MSAAERRFAAAKQHKNSTYKKEYVQRILDYFNVPESEMREKVIQRKNGKTETAMEEVAPKLPTFQGFARSLGVSSRTVSVWAEKYPEFADAFLRCKDIQEHLVIVHGLHGRYNHSFAAIVARSQFGWEEKVEIKHGGTPELLSQIAATLGPPALRKPVIEASAEKVPLPAPKAK